MFNAPQTLRFRSHVFGHRIVEDSGAVTCSMTSKGVIVRQVVESHACQATSAPVWELYIYSRQCQTTVSNRLAMTALFRVHDLLTCQTSFQLGNFIFPALAPSFWK